MAAADSALTVLADSLGADYMPDILSEEDYVEVAGRLGIEVAAVKAVVEIEAGKGMGGFVEPGMPIINFDLTQFNRLARKHNISLAKYRKSHAVVFARPNAKAYGGHQYAQHARLAAASQIDRKTAVYATYWGMFQIGGENWKLCGAKSYEDFVDLMSRSERDQLELFAALIEKCGYTKFLKAHDWVSFARRYNGPGFRRYSYHTRMANAYKRYSSSPSSVPEV
ncbi:MAG: N-acetylmuramidase family protein [Pseudoflavonifractor sp.]|nr:N-acetylmuramidase family protein [Alloprevotella sp.]MCM1115932.1 N-acetylmuramidase family protein [Pseudoflavonifractor sp.]